MSEKTTKSVVSNSASIITKTDNKKGGNPHNIMIEKDETWDRRKEKKGRRGGGLNWTTFCFVVDNWY